MFHFECYHPNFIKCHEWWNVFQFNMVTFDDMSWCGQSDSERQLWYHFSDSHLRSPKIMKLDPQRSWKMFHFNMVIFGHQSWSIMISKFQLREAVRGQYLLNEDYSIWDPEVVGAKPMSIHKEKGKKLIKGLDIYYRRGWGRGISKVVFSSKKFRRPPPVSTRPGPCQ